MATTLPAYLTARGLDPVFVTTTLSFAYLPYSFKWIWGPVIDTLYIPRLGKRRQWIVFAQAMMALTVIAMVTFDVTTEVKLVAWAVFVHTIFNALQDVAVDALAVELLDEEERGRANGLMFGCKYGGGLIGGYVIAKLISVTSLDTALVVQTAILVAIMLVPLLVRERAPQAEPVVRTSLHEIAGAVGHAFSLRSVLVTVLLMLGMNFATGMISANGYQLFVTQLKWHYTDYTLLVGGVALAVGGSAAAATGFLVDRFGRRSVAAAASFAMAAGWVAFALLRAHWDEPALAWASGLYNAAALAVMTVALIALCMDLTWDKIGGTHFTAFMALSNFSTVLGQQFVAQANLHWDFHGVYLVGAGIQCVVTLLLLLIDPTEVRRKLPPPEGQRVNTLGIAALVVLLVFLIGMTIRQSLKVL